MEPEIILCDSSSSDRRLEIRRVEANRIALIFQNDDFPAQRFECDQRSLWNVAAGCGVDLASASGALHVVHIAENLRMDYRSGGEKLSRFVVSASDFAAAFHQITDER